MGALHDGHRALIDQARRVCQSVVVSVFVNPMQFAPGEDLARYPARWTPIWPCAGRAGVDMVWAPAVADVYPGGSAQVRIDPGPGGAILEGA